MKVLIVHHLETVWESGFEMYGTSAHEQAQLLADYIEENDFDLFLFTRFEDNELEDLHFYYGFQNLNHRVFDYAYGWEQGSIEGQEGVHWAEGGSHSEIVWLPKWLKQMKGQDVHLCGAFDGECIEDIELAMDAIGIEYTRIEELIV